MMRHQTTTTVAQQLRVLFVASSTFLFVLATSVVQFGVHGISLSLVSHVVRHHDGRIKLRWWRNNNSNSNRTNNKSHTSSSTNNNVMKTISIIGGGTATFPCVEDQSMITITVNNVLYEDSSYQQQYPPLGIKPSVITITEQQQQQKQQQQQQHVDIATDMAQIAKEFDQALVVASSMNTNTNTNTNTNDLNVGNLLIACDRLEKAMRQFGFTQSAKGISGNVKKIRDVYNRPLPAHINRDSLVAIVQHEFETGVHDITSKHTNTIHDNTINKNVNKNNNNNKDSQHHHHHHTQTHHALNHSSATMGFLWLGRSISYQHDMFRQMLDHEDETPYNAAKFAYEKVLKPHLSWPKQKACQTAIAHTKPLQLTKHELLCRMGGFEQNSYSREEEKATKRDLRKVVNSWSPMLNQWKQTFMDLDLAQI